MHWGGRQRGDGAGRGGKDLKECTQFFLNKTRDTKAL